MALWWGVDERPLRRKSAEVRWGKSQLKAQTVSVIDPISTIKPKRLETEESQYAY